MIRKHIPTIGGAIILVSLLFGFGWWLFVEIVKIISGVI